MRKVDKNSLHSPNDILINATSLNEYNETLTNVIWRSELVPTERKIKQMFDRECYSLHKKLKNSDPLAEKTRQKRLFKRLCQNKRRELELVFESRVVAEAETDTQNFWRMLKSKRKPAENCQVQNNAGNISLVNYTIAITTLKCLQPTCSPIVMNWAELFLCQR